MLVKTTRGDIKDLSYEGHIAVTNEKGELLYSYGDPKRLTFIRSSAKPLQALVAVESGAVDKYKLNPKEIAVICASHIGSQDHIETVKSILEKASLLESNLKCGSHMPRDKNSLKRLLCSDKKATEIYNNCSGKHSGMLITCKYLRDDMDSYYENSHPHQKRILDIISQFTGVEKKDIVLGNDGCGVPVHAVELYKFAKAFAILSKPETFDKKRVDAIKRVTDAMTNHPDMVSGNGEICTELMKRTNGRIIAKGGANAYYALSIKDKGIGVTIKIESGNSDILPIVILETLRQIGEISDNELKLFEDFTNGNVKNNKGETVGKTTAEFILKKH